MQRVDFAYPLVHKYALQLIIMVGLLLSYSTTAHAAPCHTYTYANTPQSTLGAPYDVFDSAHRTLVRVDCSDNTIQLTLGNTGRKHLIHTTGYIEFSPGVFTPFPITPATAAVTLDTSWIVAHAAQGTITVPPTAYGTTAYIYTYLCQVRSGAEGKSLKCGCNATSQHSCTQTHGTYAGSWTLQKVTIPTPTTSTHNTEKGFRILIGTNQLYPEEAAQAHRFAADGAWVLHRNSPPGINWKQTLKTLNADTWTVSENNPGGTGGVTNFTVAHTGKMVDAAMFYEEIPMKTILPDTLIDHFAAHTVAGYGSIGKRMVVLTRSFGVSDPRRAELIHALSHPMVVGATFEFNPSILNPAWKIPEGCAYVLSLGKQCYLLMPPIRDGNTDFLSSIQQALKKFEPSGVLRNPNTYLIPAVYARPNNQHFLSTSPSDRNSIEAIVTWLKAYRREFQ